MRFLECLLTNPLMFLSEAQEHCRATHLVAIPLSTDGALGYVAWFLKIPGNVGKGRPRRSP